MVATALLVVACNKADSPESSTPADVAQATTTFAQDFEPEYVGGYPTNETVEAMFEEYDYQAAVQFYVWGYAYLNNLGHEKGMARMKRAWPGWAATSARFMSGTSVFSHSTFL
jgi:hypothetical protein